ncbi:MAG: hypothetical protein KKA05_10325 [Alphaproteobacteria bacterium]|nr:hypothetical protein [Alphaproteobacteria bacterium]
MIGTAIIVGIIIGCLVLWTYVVQLIIVLSLCVIAGVRGAAFLIMALIGAIIIGWRWTARLFAGDLQ